MSLQKQVSEILGKGGFILRKWCSNNKNVIIQLHTGVSSDSPFVIIIGNDDTKASGILWLPNVDQLYYAAKEPKENARTIAKRAILSLIAQIFNPLGLISSIIIVPKLIIQKLWQLNLNWDEAVPSSMHSQWKRFIEQLTFINKIMIPHHVICDVFNELFFYQRKPWFTIYFKEK